jgi:hypothetical protein
MEAWRGKSGWPISCQYSFWHIHENSSVQVLQRDADAALNASWKGRKGFGVTSARPFSTNFGLCNALPHS